MSQLIFEIFHTEEMKQIIQEIHVNTKKEISVFWAKASHKHAHAPQ